MCGYLQLVIELFDTELFLKTKTFAYINTDKYYIVKNKFELINTTTTKFNTK